MKAPATQENGGVGVLFISMLKGKKLRKKAFFFDFKIS